MAKKKVYGVKNGKVPGIYKTWQECEKQIKGYSGAEYKGFSTEEEAKIYVYGTGVKALREEENKNAKKSTEEQEKSSSMSNNTIKDPNILKAYVDGSYNQGTKEYSCGVVLLLNGKELLFSKKGNAPHLASMRNVAGELLGAQYAMAFALKNQGKFKELWIYHDYTGIEKWCTGEWKTKQAGTEAYKKYYQEKIRGKVDVRFKKVRAHSGDHYNDKADELAKKALDL
ncbi:ribonuclease H1 domain-containing protein [Isachenkonia alkalipeptolytica]|uniref:Ribonuclease H n=1 Tax=Isachenkonia alkalipeptolytica TaxID=2565777 RepID=A0AA44BE14_9CLOT|nr:ribonuclease H family protein [Isachenkonia alkalipeptolytica]NBG86996.1 RNase H [Isachenkonia alkalipeptolytica]